MKDALFSLLLILITGISLKAYGQAEDFEGRSRNSGGTEYLFGPNTSWGGWGGSFVEIGSTDNQFSVFTGGGGGVLFNRSLFIGGFGQDLSNDIEYELPVGERANTDARLNLDMGMGGMWVGYSFPARKAVHLTAMTKFGWGDATLYYVRNNRNDNSDVYAQDDFFMIAPQGGLEANLAPWFRISLEGGYRFISGANLPVVETLDGAYGTMTLRFGWFQ